MKTATNSRVVARPHTAADIPSVHIVPHTMSAQALFTLIGQARAGLNKTTVRTLSQRLELTVRELAPILDTTERTLARRLEGSGELGKSESERVLLLRQLADHGLDVFEEQGKFNRWLRRPLPLLQGQSPLQLQDTASGFQLVDEVLGHIEHGVFS